MCGEEDEPENCGKTSNLILIDSFLHLTADDPLNNEAADLWKNNEDEALKKGIFLTSALLSIF